MSAAKHESVLEAEYARLLARTEKPATPDIYSADDTRPAELVENLAGGVGLLAFIAGFCA